jgi:tetratricopeptide (TPR) repeat protein
LKANILNLKSTAIVAIFTLTVIAYSNHFNNVFHFDDTHTVVQNAYIRDIKNIPLFFKDGTTSSVLPQNQVYRPVVSTSIALDYWMSKSYTPFYFHLSMFLLFLLQGVLIFLLISKILETTADTNYNFSIAACAAGWYLVHPAIAETVNYVIARSDMLSTFFLMAGFICYQYFPKQRRYYFYLIPVIIGSLAKPPAVLFAPLLALYILFFEEQVGLLEVFNKENRNKLIKLIKQVTIPFICCLFLYVFIAKMTPSSWVPGGLSRWNYLITEPFVIFHYFTTFFLPTELSADSDWTTLNSIMDIRFLIGSLFIITLVTVGFLTSKDRNKRPISFGIFWFLLTLLPTSSIIPLAEVLNDHRMYLPFIGLAISITYSLYYFIIKKWMENKANLGFNKYILSSLIVLLFVVYAYGTYQRNIVWRTEESLWYDVTIKSPKNGRGLMNYGLEKMAKGQYEEANTYFHQALVFNPYYHYLFINLGILSNLRGKADSAQYFFNKALEHGNNYANTHFYYGRYLKTKKDFPLAISELNKSISLSPGYLEFRIELLDLYDKTRNWQELRNLSESSLQIFPDNEILKMFLSHANLQKNNLDLASADSEKNTTPEILLDLSLQYYNDGRFLECIDKATKAIALKPNYAEAYNNIGAAYIALLDFDKAILPLEKAISINPSFNLALNNLNYAKSKITNTNGKKELQLNAGDYIQKSLVYYNQKEYLKCIEQCYKALELQPSNDIAYNNICASYNQLQQWDNSIAAGKKGLTLNPNNQLLKNNLQVALDAKKAGK